MQMVISEIAFTFVDDAVALARGFTDVARILAVESLAAIRARICGPVERLALACDVGNVIPVRQDAMTLRRRQTRWNASARASLRERLNPFCGLYDLT